LDQASRQTNVKRAIDNNIALCESVAMANGIHPISFDGIWLSLQPMPPYYPNLITTLPDIDISEHIKQLNGLLSLGWGVKDSYSDLDLASDGFEVAVSGSWFSVTISAASQSSPPDDSKVVIVQSKEDFTQWISAWDPAMEGKIFPSDIWRKDDLSFVFVERKTRVVGGFLLNSTRGNIGLSNWFGELSVVNSALRTLFTSPQSVVGYASNDEFKELSGFGFEPLHAMKVWING